MSDSEHQNDVSVNLRNIAAFLMDIAQRSEVEEQPIVRKVIPIRQTVEVEDALALAWLASEELAERRRRTSMFSAELFGEPAWDILLDLYVGKVKGKRISITSACIAANVPPTTALRWLTVLEHHGLVRRMNDEFDQRRTWVTLTSDGFMDLTNYLRKRSNQREPHFVGIGRMRTLMD